MSIDKGALALAKQINKDMKEDLVLIAGEFKPKPRITTGSLSLDVALGGGWPANVWSEVVGPPSSGKTALCLRTIAANQEKDPNWTAVWIAAEPWVPQYAEMMGVDTSRVLVVETQILEDALDVVLTYAKSRTIDCVVIDSLPALFPVKEDDKDMGEDTVGRRALLVNKFFRKVGKAMKRSATEDDRPMVGLCINQWRFKIGVLKGDPRTTSGGEGKNYAFFVRAEVSRGEWRTTGADKTLTRVGQTMQIKIFKNKTAKPQQVASTDFYFDDAPPHKAGDFDFAKEIVAIGILWGIIERRGGWYYYGEQKWHGANDVLASVREDIDLKESVSREVMEAVKRAAQ